MPAEHERDYPNWRARQSGKSDIGESAIFQGSNFADKTRFGTEMVHVLRPGEFLNCPLSPVFIMDYEQVWLAKLHGPDWVEGRTKQSVRPQIPYCPGTHGRDSVVGRQLTIN